MTSTGSTPPPAGGGTSKGGALIYPQQPPKDPILILVLNLLLLGGVGYFLIGQQRKASRRSFSGCSAFSLAGSAQESWPSSAPSTAGCRRSSCSRDIPSRSGRSFRTIDSDGAPALAGTD